MGELGPGKNVHRALDFANKGLALGVGNDDYLIKMYLLRSDIFQKLGKIDLAIEDCTTAIEMDERRYSAWEKRGTLYMKKKEYEEAVHDFQQAYNIDSMSATALRNLEEAKRKMRSKMKTGPVLGNT